MSASEESHEATKQITVGFLGTALIASIVVAFLRPEVSQSVLGVDAAIITALAAVVKR